MKIHHSPNDPPNDPPNGRGEPWASLPLEIDPPAAAEHEILGSLRRQGFFTAPRRPASRFRAAAAAAVLLVVFGGGYRLGARSRSPLNSPTPPQRHLLLLYDTVAGSEAQLTAAGEAERFTEYSRWAAELTKRSRLIAAAKLEDGEVRLGPPADSARARPSGFFLLATENTNEAEAIARSCPHLGHGGAVSLRTVATR